MLPSLCDDSMWDQIFVKLVKVETTIVLIVLLKTSNLYDDWGILLHPLPEFNPPLLIDD